MSYKKKLQSHASDYLQEHPEATAREIAAWMISTGKWQPHPSAIERRLADEIADAMREEYFTDRQGRSVRAKHAARVRRNGEQMTLWADLRSASPQHMAISFKQRRRQIVGDCFQLKVDVDSFNQNVNSGQKIQLPLDFTNDVAELETLDGSGTNAA